MNVELNDNRERNTAGESSLPSGVYENTADSLKELVDKFSYYKRVTGFFADGENKIQLKKRFMLKMLDETWVKAVEDAIPSLDAVIRRPGRTLIESEELRPIEQTRRVSSRSIQHLCQHTDLINEIKRDGSVMPSKLLNVFQDETVITYENRFINTLVSRLFAFVCLRVDAAEECGVDEKLSALSFDQSFSDGDKRAKISLKIELSEKPAEDEVVKNHVYSGDLWKRALRLRRLVSGYASSDFVREMGKNYVRPPVMRTNLLLKNVDFRQCLSLWEFLDGYENVGYETLVQEDVETVTDDCAQDFYRSLAEQYVLFLKHVENVIKPENALDERAEERKIPYKIKSELDPLDERDFTYTDKIPDKTPDNTDGLAALFDKTDYAVRVAVAADKILFDRENAEIGNSGFNYRYRCSFLARLVLAGDPTQEYYTQIKNCLLSYAKVRSRVSWNHELFAAGRKKFARINVKGKTVLLYLPINAESADGKYRLENASDSAANRDFPSVMRVKSARGVKYAKELVDIIAANLGLIKLAEPKYEDYHIPYATREEMARRVPQLVRIIGEPPLTGTGTPQGETEPPFKSDGEERSETGVRSAGDVTDGKDSENGETAAAESAGGKIPYRYRYSFLARLIQSGETVQSLYGEIKNRIMSYGKVKSSVAWGHESFRYGRRTVIKLKIRGKSVVAFFALSPSDYAGTKYRVKDLTDENGTPALSAAFKIRSRRAAGYAKDLVDDVMKKCGAEFAAERNDDYSREYMSTEEMLNLPEPLVKRAGAPEEVCRGKTKPSSGESVAGGVKVGGTERA